MTYCDWIERASEGPGDPVQSSPASPLPPGEGLGIPKYQMAYVRAEV